MRVTLSSSPELFSRYETYQQGGTYSAGPVTTDTTFTFGLRDDDEDIGSWEHSVHVVLPERESIVYGTFEGDCYDTIAGWEDLDLSAGVFRSELVRLVKACNMNRFAVDLTLNFETGMEHYTLIPTECTREYEESLGSKVLSAQARPLDPGVAAAADCSATYKIPPEDFEIAFFLVCGSESTERAVVAATPEPTPTLIELIWETPTSTSEIVPSLPMATFVKNANCRYGPETVYDVLTSFLEGQEVLIEGQSATKPKWWWILIPESSAHCWVSDSTVQVLGPDTEVAIIAAPPTPTASPAPVQGCLHQGPNDNQPLCYVPCPPNPNPGGACTP